MPSKQLKKSANVPMFAKNAISLRGWDILTRMMDLRENRLRLPPAQQSVNVILRSMESSLILPLNLRVTRLA